MSEPVKIFCRGCHSKLDVSDLEPFSRVPCPCCGTQLRVPKRFDRYLLEKVCGIGGMSKVYRAIEPDLARRVAVKILNPDCPDREKVADRFLGEAQLVARLNHPGVIPIYNCGSCDGQPFLVMRFMEHGSLEEHFKAGTLPPYPHLLECLTVVAEGLKFALERDNIIHHDVKPGNILLTAENEAKLGDFDLADVREEGDELSWCDGWASPAYVSPERLFSGCEDHRGDIFSFGVSIYELLGGAAPFGLNGSVEELLERRRAEAFRPLSDRNDRVSPQLSKLVGRMLAYAPESRPGYSEIVETLQAESEDDVVRPAGSLLGRMGSWLKHKG